jgi:hypothetical protein
MLNQVQHDSSGALAQQNFKYLCLVFLEMILVRVNQPILNTMAAPVSPAAQPAHKP